MLSGDVADPDPEPGPPSSADLDHLRLDEGPWDDDGLAGRPEWPAHPPQPVPAADAGWWAAADRALDDAGQAVEGARRPWPEPKRAGPHRRGSRPGGRGRLADRARWAPDARRGRARRPPGGHAARNGSCSATCSRSPVEAGWPNVRASHSPTHSPGAGRAQPTSRSCVGRAAAVGLRADGPQRAAATTSPTAPGSARRVRRTPTGPRPRSTAACAPATDAVDSRDAVAACPGAASSTTASPTRWGPPAPPTSSATAPPTTAASTRRPGGSTGSSRTAR